MQPIKESYVYKSHLSNYYQWTVTLNIGSHIPFW